MDKYNVLITDKALGDMNEIYTYIAEILKEPDTAIKQYNRIAEAIEKLDTFPNRIKIMDSNPEHSWGLRQLRVDNYSVFYIIENKNVIVIRVLYSASDINKRLTENEF